MYECQEGFPKCHKKFKTEAARDQHERDAHGSSVNTAEEAFEKVWDGECENCGQSPTVRATGLCGPCTFGEADTLGGNW